MSGFWQLNKILERKQRQLSFQLRVGERWLGPARRDAAGGKVSTRHTSCMLQGCKPAVPATHQVSLSIAAGQCSATAITELHNNTQAATESALKGQHSRCWHIAAGCEFVKCRLQGKL